MSRPETATLSRMNFAVPLRSHATRRRFGSSPAPPRRLSGFVQSRARYCCWIAATSTLGLGDADGLALPEGVGVGEALALGVVAARSACGTTLPFDELDGLGEAVGETIEAEGEAEAGGDAEGDGDAVDPLPG